MKGFGIEIKNDLLEKKHIESMGIAVWMYMWCIDKMTSISEDGIGKVLGGKPIRFKEIGDELGISIRTYQRWSAVLSEHGYINTLRTPYGVVISVNKAHKRFGKRYATNDTSDTTNMAHLYDKSGTSNKTVSVDKTIDTIAAVAARAEKSKKSAEESNKMIAEYNFDEYLKSMEDNPSRHIQVIAFYFKKKKLRFKTLQEVQSAIRRHLRAAREVANFDDDAIVGAYKKADREYQNLYTVETLLKILTR